MRKLYLSLLSALFLTSCGGGSGGSQNTTVSFKVSQSPNPITAKYGASATGTATLTANANTTINSITLPNYFDFTLGDISACKKAFKTGQSCQFSFTFHPSITSPNSNSKNSSVLINGGGLDSQKIVGTASGPTSAGVLVNKNGNTINTGSPFIKSSYNLELKAQSADTQPVYLGDGNGSYGIGLTFASGNFPGTSTNGCTALQTRAVSTSSYCNVLISANTGTAEGGAVYYRGNTASTAAQPAKLNLTINFSGTQGLLLLGSKASGSTPGQVYMQSTADPSATGWTNITPSQLTTNDDIAAVTSSQADYGRAAIGINNGSNGSIYYQVLSAENNTFTPSNWTAVATPSNQKIVSLKFAPYDGDSSDANYLFALLTNGTTQSYYYYNIQSKSWTNAGMPSTTIKALTTNTSQVPDTYAIDDNNLISGSMIPILFNAALTNDSSFSKASGATLSNIASSVAGATDAPLTEILGSVSNQPTVWYSFSSGSGSWNQLTLSMSGISATNADAFQVLPNSYGLAIVNSGSTYYTTWCNSADRPVCTNVTPAGTSGTLSNLLFASDSGYGISASSYHVFFASQGNNQIFSSQVSIGATTFNSSSWKNITPSGFSGLANTQAMSVLQQQGGNS